MTGDVRPPKVEHVVEEHIVAERGDSPQGDGGWLVMYPDGNVRGYVDRQHATRAIERHARAVQKRTGADAVLTRVDWRGIDAAELPIH